MKTINLLFGALVILAALVAAPAFAVTLLAGSAGGMLMATAAVMPSPPVNAPVVSVAKVAGDPVRVFELDNGGVVVFRTVNGKLVSRFYRA